MCERLHFEKEYRPPKFRGNKGFLVLDPAVTFKDYELGICSGLIVASASQYSALPGIEDFSSWRNG
jgi:hypothetical protein